MRYIDDLRDHHNKDEEIWVIGCGPSLDDFPTTFFKDKITIALNRSIFRFPDCTYWHGHHEPFREYLRDEKPEFLEKSIILYPFPGPFKHGRITQPKEFFGELVSKPIWMKFWDTRPIPRSAFEDVVKYIVEKQTPPQGYRASMAVGHTAIEAAAIMGATRITLTGCEHSSIPGKTHAQRGGMSERYERSNGNLSYLHPVYPLPGQPHLDTRQVNGTKWLTELFEPHGIEVIRYFYISGYERIIA